MSTSSTPRPEEREILYQNNHHQHQQHQREILYQNNQHQHQQDHRQQHPSPKQSHPLQPVEKLDIESRVTRLENKLETMATTNEQKLNSILSILEDIKMAQQQQQQIKSPSAITSPVLHRATSGRKTSLPWITSAASYEQIEDGSRRKTPTTGSSSRDPLDSTRSIKEKQRLVIDIGSSSSSFSGSGDDSNCNNGRNESSGEDDEEGVDEETACLDV